MFKSTSEKKINNKISLLKKSRNNLYQRGTSKSKIYQNFMKKTFDLKRIKQNKFN